MTKNIREKIWRNAFNDLDENGDLIQQPRKIKSDTSVLLSNNNRRTWSNPEIKLKRSKGIKKTKQENGCLTDEQKLQCYKDSFGVGRNKTLYKELAKKYNVKIYYIQHIASNYFNFVSDEEHKKNIEEWNEKYGFFGKWRLTSPGINLLDDYDEHWKNNKIPPSAIFYIRFELEKAQPKVIRDYLLPWTDGEYIKFPDGRIANGRYINYRKKQYPFLTQEIGDIYEFNSMDELHSFLKIYYGNSLTRTYVHQILNGSKIKEEGPMIGWKFEKIK